MKTIAILLTVHNRKDKTLRCLKNVYHQLGINENYHIDVFLVDDASDDGTADAVRKAFPLVNIIQGSGNLFWNRGMHLAWQVAAKAKNYDNYLWLNDDTILMKNAIELLLSTQQNQAIVVCGAICSEKDHSFTYGGKDAKGNYVIPNGASQPCIVINGNCVLVPRKVYEEIGTLDPIFPHAIGDHDYGLRVINAGFQVLTTSTFVGYCERNTYLPTWCYMSTPIYKRLRALYSPLGNAHPYYFFIYENRHFSFTIAAKHFITIHLRALIPILWK